MDEKDCLILQYLYENPNLTKAAERFYMTQPALTYRIRQIEKEFQILIFSKNGKNIKITPAGEYIVGYAKRMLTDLRRTKEYLLNMGNEVQGSLKIGVSSNFGLYKLPSILEYLMNQYPKVHVNVDTGFSTEMMDLLMEGEIDVAIVKGDYNWSDQTYLLNEENICLISKNEIDLDELPELPMINRKEPAVLMKYKNVSSSPLDKSINSWWDERYEQPPHITMQVDSYETCKEMVKKGLGYAIIPRVFIHESDELTCHNLIFKDGQELKRRTWMLFRQSSLQLATVSTFVNYIKKIF
ncbi:LysR family transcriptional regulator [Metabacillus sediminilitoris]|uniref:LysR family transcriptional regulator n=1 Tax=Metabacillus sediminilitoris TaxID=2567941 RepID=A0A4V3WF88_9BACI|nr:LysR family transcriptional regulator [Metabacillus sediminilitoris]QGQ46257.1 LysR family transcriptional regulator [Metabacillus sediminilitoris]THF79309.1 LysR family transcriptional regulator [Metabacillus sediminilitoris]